MMIFRNILNNLSEFPGPMAGRKLDSFRCYLPALFTEEAEWVADELEQAAPGTVEEFSSVHLFTLIRFRGFSLTQCHIT